MRLDRVLLLAAGLAIFAMGIRVVSNPKKDVSESYVEDEEQNYYSRPKKNNGKSSRAPASSATSSTRTSNVANQSSFTEGARSSSHSGLEFTDTEREQESSESAPVTYSADNNPNNYRQRSNPSRNSSSVNNSNDKSNNPSSSSASIGAIVGASPPGLFSPTVTPPKGPDTPVVYNKFSCSSNFGSGSYDKPIRVSLSCSTNATIKYCISEGTCCDPDSGPVYSGPITVGSVDKTYCLSFKGIAKNGNVTSSDRRYAFHIDVPDINTEYQKIWYQTTELPVVMSMTSDDFGKNSYTMGIINLKNHNPNPSALNLSCSEILDQFPGMTSAVPSQPMLETDISGLSPSAQMNGNIGLSDLAYQENYITTYFKNGNTNSVSCSTTKLTLVDFPYFDASPLHGEVGTNDIRVFAGGFTHLGFFEPEATVYRGPAGSSSETKASQELKSSLFEVFY